MKLCIIISLHMCLIRVIINYLNFMEQIQYWPLWTLFYPRLYHETQFQFHYLLRIYSIEHQRKKFNLYFIECRPTAVILNLLERCEYLGTLKGNVYNSVLCPFCSVG